MSKQNTGFWGRLIRRTLLLIVTAAIAVAIGGWLTLDLIFNGPSPTARNQLVVHCCQSDSIQWIPGVFLDEDTIGQILAEEQEVAH